jgi:hypothetical protein
MGCSNAGSAAAAAAVEHAWMVMSVGHPSFGDATSSVACVVLADGETYLRVKRLALPDTTPSPY